MEKHTAKVEEFKELLPQKQTNSENFLSSFNEAFTSDDGEKINELPGKFEKLPKEQQNKVMNATKQMNQSMIIETVKTLSAELGRMPTVFEISAKTNLSETTIYTHIRELRGHEYKQQEMIVLGTQRSKFLNVIFQAGLEDSKAALMALDLISKEEERMSQIGQSNDSNIQTIIQAMLTLIPKDKQNLAKKVLKEIHAPVIEICSDEAKIQSKEMENLAS